MVTKDLQLIANILRRDSILTTTGAGSGHPTSCLSCADIMSVLFFDEMKFDPTQPFHSDKDEFILSKGHAAPIFYSALKHAGCISEDLFSLRDLHSTLEGHPIPPLHGWVHAATGSLGQGLSIGVGMALAAKKSESSSRIYVLLGDSEMSEGSIYEALQLASYYKLNNLCAIVDINRLGQRGETMIGHNLNSYKKRIQSFGWKAITINGHSIPEIKRALKSAKKSKTPTCILAKTIKGKGVSFLEDKNGWHGKTLSQEELDLALKELPHTEFPLIRRKKLAHKTYSMSYNISPLHFSKGENIATREAYGQALSIITKNKHILALDAEVSNSTYSDKVKDHHPSQFIECFIAEQNMIGMSQGLASKHFYPFSSTFAAFLTRAHDQLRMAAISNTSMAVVGSHSGVSIGQDGASQMGLEDISLFRSLPNTTVLYPSDAVSTQSLVSQAPIISGLTYIRTTRAKTPVIYPENEHFPLNEFKVLRSSSTDKAVLVGAGITLHEALKAHEKLKELGINTAVIDCYCIKPFPIEDFMAFVKYHGKKIVIAEDHYSEGGIGEMIAHQCANCPFLIQSLAVHSVPHSGSPEELLKHHHLDSESIAKVAYSLIKQ